MNSIDLTLINWKKLSKNEQEQVIEKAKEYGDEYSFINEIFDYEIEREFQNKLEAIKENLFQYGIEKAEIYTNVSFSNDNMFQFRVIKADTYKFLSSMNRDGFFKDIFGMPDTEKEIVLKEFLSNFRLVSRQIDLDITKFQGPYELVLSNYNNEKLFYKIPLEIRTWCEEWTLKFNNEKECNREINKWYNEFCENSFNTLNKVFRKYENQKEMNALYDRILNQLDEEDGLYFERSGKDLIPSNYSNQDFQSTNIQ